MIGAPKRLRDRGLLDEPMPHLPADWCEFITTGVSHRLGGCSRDGQPAVARGLAAEVLDDGRLRVLLDRQAGWEVVQAIRETGQVAVVISRPSSHRTLHLKGRDGTVAPAGPELQPLLLERRESFGRDIERLGFTRETVAKFWYDVADDDLVAITFSLSGAWDQTPGPGAGRPVELL